MRTARLLPISPSMHCAGGVSAPGGVPASGSRGGAPGGCLPLVLGGVWFGGCIPACNGADPPPPREQNSERFWKYYLVPTSLRAVKIIKLVLALVLQNRHHFVYINTNESSLVYGNKLTGFPLGLENLEKWEGIFQSGNFEQTGKVRENHTKYWKTQEIWNKILFDIFSDI